MPYSQHWHLFLLLYSLCGVALLIVLAVLWNKFIHYIKHTKKGS